MTGVPSPKAKWYYNRWVVLVIITPLLLGPFGLPLLWKSPNFSRSAKIVLTIVTVIWTVLLIRYVIVRVVPAVTNEINQFKSTLQF